LGLAHEFGTNRGLVGSCDSEGKAVIGEL
jgi:hypothetical protein